MQLKEKLKGVLNTYALKHSVYLVATVPRVPPSFNGKIEVAEGKSSGSHRNHWICITTERKDSLFIIK